MTIPNRSGWRSFARAALAIAALSCGPLAAQPASPAAPVSFAFSVDVLSGRADMVAGGDALVCISVPRNVPLQR